MTPTFLPVTFHQEPDGGCNRKIYDTLSLDMRSREDFSLFLKHNKWPEMSNCPRGTPSSRLQGRVLQNEGAVEVGQ